MVYLCFVCSKHRRQTKTTRHVEDLFYVSFVQSIEGRQKLLVTLRICFKSPGTVTSKEED